MHTVKDKVPQRDKTFATRKDSYLIYWERHSIWLNPGLNTFYYYSGTVARLYPWFFFFYEWPLHIWALCGHLAFLLHCHAWWLVEATWSACLMWAKVITAIAITIITYGFSTSRQIANQKASMVGFQTVDFGDTIQSSAGSKLHASRSIDHLGQVIHKLVSVNGYNLVIISFRP